MKFSLPLLLIALVIACGFTEDANKKIEQWTPTDLEFKTSITWKFSPTDTFEIDFHAEISGPDNMRMKHPGFYDGRCRKIEGLHKSINPSCQMGESCSRSPCTKRFVR